MYSVATTATSPRYVLRTLVQYSAIEIGKQRRKTCGHGSAALLFPLYHCHHWTEQNYKFEVPRRGGESGRASSYINIQMI